MAAPPWSLSVAQTVALIEEKLAAAGYDHTVDRAALHAGTPPSRCDRTESWPAAPSAWRIDEAKLGDGVSHPRRRPRSAQIFIRLGAFLAAPSHCCRIPAGGFAPVVTQRVPRGSSRSAGTKRVRCASADGRPPASALPNAPSRFRLHRRPVCAPTARSRSCGYWSSGRQ